MQLVRLFESDDLSVNRTTLLPRKLSPKEQFQRLGTADSDCFELDDFFKVMVPLWLFLKSNEDLPYDPNDLIAKLLELSVIVRRMDRAKAFGSASKGAVDKILKPSKSILNLVERIEKDIGKTELPEAVRLQLADASTKFSTYILSLNKIEQALKHDEQKFISIYQSLGKTFGDKGRATQVINCLIADLQNLGLEVSPRFKDGSWTRKLNQKKSYRRKANKT